MLILGLSLCRLLTSHISQQKQAGMPVRLTAVAFQYLRGDAAVWQLEEAVRREFFLLCLTGKRPQQNKCLIGLKVQPCAFLHIY